MRCTAARRGSVRRTAVPDSTFGTIDSGHSTARKTSVADQERATGSRSLIIQFGFGVPIFANPEMAFFRTPCYERLDWNVTKGKEEESIFKTERQPSLPSSSHFFRS